MPGWFLISSGSIPRGLPREVFRFGRSIPRGLPRGSSFGVDGIDGEIARPAGWPRAMEVEIGIERVGVEIIVGRHSDSRLSGPKKPMIRSIFAPSGETKARSSPSGRAVPSA